MPRSQTDDELLRRSAEDPDAFGVFYRRHAPALLAYARYRTGDIELAADLTADVFAAAFTGRRRYEPRSEPARAWLFGIANNLIAQHHRTTRRADAARRRLELIRPELDRDAWGIAETETSGALRDGLERALTHDLTPPQRAAVLGRIVDEADYRDLAATQGTTQAVVRQRVSRGLSRLAASLRKENA